MSNIFNIQQELLNIFDAIEESDGDISPELEEKLTIAQDNFNNKIKDYYFVIKNIENDINVIKDEQNRLKVLKESKEKTIARLKNIIINAVEQFGNTNKNGNKFVDFGIGKVTIRTTNAIEIDEESTNNFIQNLIRGLNWYNLNNQLDKSIINENNLIDYANSSKNYEDSESVIFNNYDIDNLGTSINLKVPLRTLLSDDKGFDLIKSIVKYGEFDIKPNISKTDIKNNNKIDGDIPSFAKIVKNKTINIK